MSFALTFVGSVFSSVNSTGSRRNGRRNACGAGYVEVWNGFSSDCAKNSEPTTHAAINGIRLDSDVMRNRKPG